MLRVGEKLVARSGRADLAAVEDHHPVAHILDIGEEMRGEEDRLPTATELEDEVLHLARAERIEARGRLVEDEELGVVHERLREAETPRHALRELSRRPVRHALEADHLEQLRRAAVARAAVEAEELAVVVERLGRVEEAIEVGLLGQVADLALDGDIARIAPEDDEPAARLVQEAEDHLDRRRLAGTVRPEEAEDLMAIDVEIDAIHGLRGGAEPEVGEGLRQPDGVDDAVAGTLLCVRHA